MWSRQLPHPGHAFSDFARLLAHLGFVRRRTTGSHHVYAHPNCPGLVNIQEVNGQAKAYQVKQVWRLVERLQSEAGGRAVSHYHINVFYSDEDAAWVADIPDLQFCSAFGATPEEAVAEVEKARELWLEVAREDGRPIPAPSYRATVASR